MPNSSFNGRLCDRNSGDSMLSDLIRFGDNYSKWFTLHWAFLGALLWFW
ncbi:hypothetical protein [Nostoc sp.]